MVSNKGENYIQRLNEGNYTTWRVDMRALLQTKELWTIVRRGIPLEVVDAGDASAQPGPSSTETSGGEAAATTTTSDVNEDLLIKDEKAQGLITLNVQPTLRHLYSGAKTARDVWLRLEEHFMRRDDTRIAEALLNFYGIKHEAGESVTVYVGRLVRQRDILADLGAAVDNAQLKALLLKNLRGGPEFLHARAVLTTAITDDTVSFDEVVSRLMIFESGYKEALQKDRGKAPGGSAYVAARAEFGGRCRECGKTGHKASQCRKLKNKKADAQECTYCGKKGHVADHCFRKRTDEKRAKSEGDGTQTPGTAFTAVGVRSCLGGAFAPAQLRRQKFTAGGYDVEDFMFDRNRFEEYERRFGGFDVDGAADWLGNNAQLPQWFDKYDNSFFDNDVAGLRIWCNPPFRSAGRFLEKYLRDKSTSPETTSAVFVLPHATDATWWRLVKDWVVVDKFPAGTSLFSRPRRDYTDLRQELRPCPFDVIVLYDPPRKHGEAHSVRDMSAKFLVDSGATHHMCPDRGLLVDLREPRPDEVTWVAVGDGSTLPVVGYGNLWFEHEINGKLRTAMFTDVAYVPGLSHTLISMTRLLTKNQLGLRTEGKDIYMTSPAGSKELKVCVEGQLMYLCMVRPVVPKSGPGGAAHVATASENADLWHRRMGHLGMTSFPKLKTMSDGIQVDNAEFLSKTRDLEVCGDCMAGRQLRDVRAAKSDRSSVPLERLHTDLSGKMPVESEGGSWYYLAVIDEATRYSEVVPIKAKSDGGPVLKEIITRWQRRTDKRVKFVRSDGGGEFISNDLEAFFKSEGITHEKTTPYSPESNGMAERLNRTLAEKARSMMHWSGCEESFWAESFVYANTLRNLSPATGLDVTPYEAFIGRRPDLSRLRVFGSKTYAFVPEKTRKKLDPRCVEGALLGVDIDAHTYRVYIDGEVKICRDVVCDETQPYWTKSDGGNLNHRGDDNYDDEVPAEVIRAEGPDVIAAEVADYGEGGVDDHLDLFESDDDDRREEPASEAPAGAAEAADGSTAAPAGQDPAELPAEESTVSHSPSSVARAHLVVVVMMEPTTVAEAKCGDHFGTMYWLEDLMIWALTSASMTQHSGL